MKDPQFYSSMDLVASFSISVIVSLLVTPFVKILAKKLNYLDHPEAKKIHVKATPLLGGVSIFIAFIVAVIFTLPLEKEILAIIIGGLFLILIGLVDDRFGMMPTTKLFGQLIAALTVVKFGGVRAEFIGNYYISVIFTCFWIIGITNAINLLDNMNGLSSGLVAIASVFFAFIAFQDNNIMAASLALALCGGCIGFLRYNFPNATIFMGDTGSLFIGFCISTLAVLVGWHTPEFNISSIIVPIMILGYPIFDTTFVTILRIREGRSVFQGGKDHSSHRLSVMGLKRKNAVIIIFMIAFFIGMATLFIKELSMGLNLIFAAIILISMIIFGIILSRVNVRYAKDARK